MDYFAIKNSRASFLASLFGSIMVQMDHQIMVGVDMVDDYAILYGA
jgi:hypothetical protein